MNMIKYNIIGGTKEGMIAINTIIAVMPDTDSTCYIKVAGSTPIKAGNSVNTIWQRIAEVSATINAPASPVTFKTILQNRRLLYINLTDATSKAKLAELDVLLTLV